MVVIKNVNERLGHPVTFHGPTLEDAVHEFSRALKACGPPFTGRGLTDRDYEVLYDGDERYDIYLDGELSIINATPESAGVALWEDRWSNPRVCLAGTKVRLEDLPPAMIERVDRARTRLEIEEDT